MRPNVPGMWSQPIIMTNDGTEDPNTGVVSSNRSDLRVPFYHGDTLQLHLSGNLAPPPRGLGSATVQFWLSNMVFSSLTDGYKKEQTLLFYPRHI